MAGKLALPDPARPSEGSGLIVIGMGKLGANELNFSSDIDLIVFSSPRRRPFKDPFAAGDLFVRLTGREAPAGAHPQRAHGAWLRLPHRSAAEARSRLHAARHPRRSGAALLRKPGPETGNARR